MPIIVLLHGLGGNDQQILTYSGLEALAQSDGFILIAPQGLGKTAGWNCGYINLGLKGADDVKFISDALHDTEKSVTYDPDRVFICGHSNGAFMSYVMGSALSSEIAAIGVVAGSVGLDPKYPATQSELTAAKFLGVEIPTTAARVKAPKSPVSAIIFHGEKDPMVAYDHDPNSLLSSTYSAMDSASYWAKSIGIDTDPTTKTINSDVIDSVWLGNKGQEVDLYSIETGTHDWPGMMNIATDKEGNIITSDLIWKFFESHPKIQ